MHGNTAASYSASLTQNSIELHQWHEMEATVHSQFGTVDNPVLIFTSDSSWRIVICMGPGIEDDSHSHEKIFYMVREGPINRCQVCGQCFKIVRLKDEFSEQQDYYSMMFSTMSHFDVSEEDLEIVPKPRCRQCPQPMCGSISTMTKQIVSQLILPTNLRNSKRLMKSCTLFMRHLKSLTSKWLHKEFFCQHLMVVTIMKPGQPSNNQLRNLIVCSTKLKNLMVVSSVILKTTNDVKNACLIVSASVLLKTSPTSSVV